jgi:hypothetical protein
VNTFQTTIKKILKILVGRILKAQEENSAGVYLCLAPACTRDRAKRKLFVK